VPRGRGWTRVILWAGWAALAVVAYRAAAAALYRSGFPLDDAWIHQTYARNLAAGVGWVYRAPDLGRGAATAPLWVLILAVGHGLAVPPGLWVSLLGWAGLVGLAALAWHWPGLEGRWRWVAALAVLGQWHLVWAAVSGMETLAFALAVLAALAALVHPEPRWAWAALAAGLGLWLRPEALLLLPVAALRLRDGRDLRGGLRFAAGVGLALAAYAAFHLALAGSWGPTTGPAKMHEYAALRAAPWVRRWLRVWGPILVGPAALAVLGLFAAIALRIAKSLSRSTVHSLLPAPRSLLPAPCSLLPAPRSLLPLSWLLLHSALYAWRLPVTYQHGRYMMPVLPALTVVGVLAWQEVLNQAPAAWRSRLGLALAALAAGLGLGFLALGARAYAWDVAFIESEMVDTARWVAEHVPATAVVAAHDIGALGYYAPQPLADLAGLLDPEVIPIVRDEAALARYLQQRGARYLVTFPSWYRELDACSRPLFVTQAPYASALGGENMVVYAWQPCPEGLVPSATPR